MEPEKNAAKDQQDDAAEDRWARLKTWHQHLLPQHALTAIANSASNSSLLRRPLIGTFTRLYPVNLAEAERTLNEFVSFDDFFTRSLKPDARPLPADPDTIVSPSDGVLSRLGPIRKGRIIQAKGRDFSVDELLANSRWARHFEDGGHFTTIYLAPHDYHRVHMPLDGRLVGETRVPGRLFSVSSATSQSIDRLYARNERMSALFETRYGPVVVVLVAALLVAGIETVWGDPSERRPGRQVRVVEIDPPLELARGREIGRFHWGSTVIVLTPTGAPEWRRGLEAGQRVQLGQALT